MYDSTALNCINGNGTFVELVAGQRLNANNTAGWNLLAVNRLRHTGQGKSLLKQSCQPYWRVFQYDNNGTERG